MKWIRDKKLKDEKQTELLGETVAKHLALGDCVALVGGLGAGKTTLMKAIAREWGFRGEVTSPTFALANEYESVKGPLYHLDMYRLSEKELPDFPLEEYIDPRVVCVVEWADRVRDRLPENTLWIELKTVSESSRQVTLQSKGKSWPKRIAAF